MSYSISLVRNGSKSKIKKVKAVDFPRGGTYMVPASLDALVTEDDLDLNLTWNQAWYYYQTISKEKGIREIYGKKAKDVVPLLKKAIKRLEPMVEKERKTGKVLSETWGAGNRFRDDEADKDYWYICAKNAIRDIEKVLTLCKIAPYFTFTGD